MEALLIALLIIVVVAVIAYPLVARPEPGNAVRQTPEGSTLEGLIAQRDSAYDAIRDLDFDFQLGKLSRTDYDALRGQYKARAAQVLQQMDALTASHRRAVGDAGAIVEAEVARLRSRALAADDDGVEQEVARLRATTPRAVGQCARCGTPYHARDQFCSKCGSRL